MNGYINEYMDGWMDGCFLTAKALIYAIRAGITAAAGINILIDEWIDNYT